MKIEPLALAIARTCGAFTPDSEAFQLNNPGLLRAFSDRHKDEAHQGHRRFLSWQAGFKALCYDLTLKCAGESRSKLLRTDPLYRLLGIWEIKQFNKTVNFLRRAIGDENITENTPLEYFI